MKLFTGWVISAGLVLNVTAANAAVLAPYDSGSSPYSAVSDLDDPYAAVPPEALPYPAMPQEAPAPRYGYRPALLPVPEVYAILRESGFLPLGIPQLRGFVYTISVIDPGGDDGRLVIDARTGRIVRFMPAYRMGNNFNGDLMAAHGSAGPLPPITSVRGPPRPPASVPHVASRTLSVPMPKAAPLRASEPSKPLAAKPASEPAQQSAAVQAKPADAAQTVPQAAAPAAVEAKPATPQIQPTQEMPKVQGLE
ncbi:MAG TPA: hypothetical protein VGH62_06590 [Bradyrhizobium sp.]